MKNKSTVPNRRRLPRLSAADASVRALGQILLTGCSLVGPLFASTQLLAPATAGAVVDLDRRYALQNVGVLRAFDNLDGILGDPLLAAARKFFTAPEHSNFQWVDLASADSVMGNSTMPYSKVIDDAEILGQLTRKLRIETLVQIGRAHV